MLPDIRNEIKNADKPHLKKYVEIESRGEMTKIFLQALVEVLKYHQSGG